MRLTCDIARCGTGEYCPKADQCLRYIDREARGCYRVSIITPYPVDCEYFIPADGPDSQVSS